MVEKLNVKPGEVRVRMYNVGFGDCFLLAFPGTNETKYMLIDCGAHHNTLELNTLMTNTVQAIEAATGGRIDVLVVTHEHTDHISGFSIATSLFEEFEFGSVWLGWTENEENPRAKRIKERFDYHMRALEHAEERLRKKNELMAERISSVLGFYGNGLGIAGGLTNQKTMEWLKKRSRDKLVYCSPGDYPLAIEGVEDVRVFVLGPPTNEDWISKTGPSQGENKETYITGEEDQLLDSFSEIMTILKENDDSYDPTRIRNSTPATRDPFDGRYRLSVKRNDSKNDDQSIDLIRKLYNNSDESWRTIDYDWLDLSGELAIKLNNKTNNTSLSLAIELGKEGPVLLFPGDAQVGNWLSWQQIEWQLEDRTVTADDLLARTVLYKVGHHGSHNATLKTHGLEKMTNPALVAMIPVDEKFAKERQNWRHIPCEPLLERLQVLTKGRLLRSDKRVNELSRERHLGPDEWASFMKRIDSSDTNYHELLVKYED